MDPSTRNAHERVFEQHLVVERRWGRLEEQRIHLPNPKLSWRSRRQREVWCLGCSRDMKISPFPVNTDINPLCLITLSQVSEFR